MARSRLVLLMLMLIAGSLLPARDLHVPGAFKTIQSAVDAAASGDTVIIKEGIYREQIRMKPGVRLYNSGNRDDVVIEYVSEEGPVVIIEDADGVILQNLTFRQKWNSEETKNSYPDQMGTIFVMGCKTQIINCAVERSVRVGILAIGEKATIDVIGCVVENSDRSGIYFWKSAHGNIRDTVVRNNRQDGISAEGHGYNVNLSGNTAENNGYSGYLLGCHPVGKFTKNITRNNGETNSGELTALAWEQDIDQLHAMATYFRDNKSCYESGRAVLPYFYDDLAEVMNPGVPASVDAFTKFIGDWKAKYPDSAIPLVLQACCYTDMAWHARGSGYANTVSADGWQLFDQHLRSAERSLVAAEKTNDPDPHIYAAWMPVGMGLNYSNDRFNDLLKKGATIDRNYYSMYEKRAYSLLPRWLGSYYEPEKFARQVMTVTTEDQGKAAYAILATTLMMSEKPEELITSFHFDPATLRQGFTDILELYPDSNYYANSSARFAFTSGDREWAAEIFGTLGDDFNDNIWPRDQFDAAKRWAEGDDTVQLPTATVNAGPFGNPAAAPVSPRQWIVLLAVFGGIILLLLGGLLVLIFFAMRASRRQH